MEDLSGEDADVCPLGIEFDFNIDVVAGLYAIFGFVSMREKEDSVEGASLEVCLVIQGWRDDVICAKADVCLGSHSVLFMTESA